MTLAAHLPRAFAGALLLAVVLAGCGPASPSPAGSGPSDARGGAGGAPRSVRLTCAQPQPLERSIAVTGTLAAREAATLSAKVPGRLQVLNVDIGSLVRAGDVIGQIEPRDYELRLDQAAAALAQARATLGLSLDPDPTTPAPTTSTTTPGPDPSPGPGGGPETPSNPKRPPAVSAPTLDLDTVSSVRQAQAVLDEASKNRDRVRNLAQSGIASPSDLDTVESAHSVATARKQLALEDARTRLATLAQRRAEYEIARKQLADSTLTAPFSGAIQARIATAGEYIAAGAPVVRLVQTDPLRLRLEVPEREASLVHTSQAVRLSVEGLPGLYHGQLARLSPALSEQNRMLLVEADVPNPGDLRPGLFARAQIVVNPGEPALCVPTNALITFAGIEKVILVRDGKALEKNVTTGRRHSNVVEILSGLTNGTLVVLDPGPLRTGQPVAPEPIASR